MKILVDTAPAFEYPVAEAVFAHGLLHALPAALPAAELLYLQETDQARDFRYPNVRAVNRRDAPVADVVFSPGKNHSPGVEPHVACVLGVDHRLFPERLPWWSFARAPKDPLPALLAARPRILVTHESLRAKVARYYPAAADKLTVVGHGPSLGEHRHRPVDAVTRRITKEVYGREKSFFLAPIFGVPSDNLKRLILAYDHFRARCPEVVRLLLDGKKSDLSGAAQKALRKARFRADVEFIPSLPPDEARKVFASARALLYPSLSTHFPVAIVDAWHAEIPVMATDNELLMGAGAQVPGRDQEAMTDAMLSLVTTPFLASGLVENGKRRREDYTWAKVAKRVAQVIRSPAL